MNLENSKSFLAILRARAMETNNKILLQNLKRSDTLRKETPKSSSIQNPFAKLFGSFK
jgi:hypothetical protein